MVCMITDYVENGTDRHQCFIATGTDDHEVGVNALYHCLHELGYLVQHITVVWGEHTLDELEKMSIAPTPGQAYIHFPYWEAGAPIRV